MLMRDIYVEAYLLLPAFKLLNQEVVALRNFGQLVIHPTLEVDEILPGLKGIT
jgi:hypothetical protein